jgi:hypothetical protein
MNWLFSLYVAILFFILTPAILLRIPKNGNKYTVAGVHAIVFALLLHFTGKFVWNFSMSMEGFSEGIDAAQRGATGATSGVAAGGAANQATLNAATVQAIGKAACTRSVDNKDYKGLCNNPNKTGCQFSKNACYNNTTAKTNRGAYITEANPFVTSGDLRTWANNNPTAPKQ